MNNDQPAPTPAQIAETTRTLGSYIVNPITGDIPVSGYAVVLPAFERVLSSGNRDLLRMAVTRYLHGHDAHFKAGAHLLTQVHADGTSTLDVALVLSSRTDALLLARVLGGDLPVWDVAGRVEVAA